MFSVNQTLTAWWTVKALHKSSTVARGTSDQFIKTFVKQTSNPYKLSGNCLHKSLRTALQCSGEF